MYRFGQPFDCDRAGVKCIKCKKEVKQGDQLRYEFGERRRWCIPCSSQFDIPAHVLIDKLDQLEKRLAQLENSNRSQLTQLSPGQLVIAKAKAKAEAMLSIPRRDARAEYQTANTPEPFADELEELPF